MVAPLRRANITYFRSHIKHSNGGDLENVPTMMQVISLQFDDKNPYNSSGPSNSTGALLSDPSSRVIISSDVMTASSYRKPRVLKEVNM